MTSLSNGLYRPEPEEALRLIALPLETFAPEEPGIQKKAEEILQENKETREETKPELEEEQEERQLLAKAEKEEATEPLEPPAVGQISE